MAACQTRLTEALGIGDTIPLLMLRRKVRYHAKGAAASEQTTKYLVLFPVYFAVLMPEHMHMLVIKLCRMVACFTAPDR